MDTLALVGTEKNSVFFWLSDLSTSSSSEHSASMTISTSWDSTTCVISPSNGRRRIFQNKKVFISLYSGNEGSPEVQTLTGPGLTALPVIDGALTQLADPCRVGQLVKALRKRRLARLTRAASGAIGAHPIPRHPGQHHPHAARVGHAGENQPRADERRQADEPGIQVRKRHADQHQ